MSLWTSPLAASKTALRAADSGRIPEIDRVGAHPPGLSFSPMFLFWQNNSTDGTGRYLLWSADNGHGYSKSKTVPGPFLAEGVVRTGSFYSGDGWNPTYEDRGYRVGTGTGDASRRCRLDGYRRTGFVARRDCLAHRSRAPAGHPLVLGDHYCARGRPALVRDQ